MGENILFSEALFVISSVPERNYLFKVSYSSTKIWCENCWGLNMKTKRRFSVFIKRLLGSNWKDKHFWRVYHGLCCSILKFINKLHLNLYLHNPTGESEQFLRRSLLHTLILAKKMRLIFKMTCCTFVFFVKLIRSYLT